MELVQFNKNGGPVTIDIAVQGSNVWSYVYASDFTFKNNSAADKDPNHTLGLPVNLDNDVNAWDIRFGNMSEDAIVAAATISWTQDGQLLNTWIREVEIPASSAKEISGDALLIGNQNGAI